MAAGKCERWDNIIEPLLCTIPSEYSVKWLTYITDFVENNQQKFSAQTCEKFYSSFLVLSANYIASVASKVPATSLGKTQKACETLLILLLEKLQSDSSESSLSQADAIYTVRILCGASSPLAKGELSSHVIALKEATLPEHLMENASHDAEVLADGEDLSLGELLSADVTGTLVQSTVGDDHFSQKFLSMVTRPPSMTSGSGTAVMIGGRMTEKPGTAGPIRQESVGESLSPNEEARHAQLVLHNLQTLKRLHGAQILCEVCRDLTRLQPYKNTFMRVLAGDPLPLANNLDESLDFRSCLPEMLEDLTVVWRALSLPIYDPLTLPCTEALVKSALTCLYVALYAVHTSTAVAVASDTTASDQPGAQPKLGNCIASFNCAALVQKAVDVFHVVRRTLHASSRVSGQTVLNVHAMCASAILPCLHSTLLLLQGEPGSPAEGASEEDTDMSGIQEDAGRLQRNFASIDHTMIALSRLALSSLTAIVRDVDDLHTTPATMGMTSDGVSTRLSLNSDCGGVERLRFVRGRAHGGVLGTLMLLCRAFVQKHKTNAQSKASKGPVQEEGAAEEDEDLGRIARLRDSVSWTMDASRDVWDEDSDDDSEPLFGSLFCHPDGDEPTASRSLSNSNLFPPSGAISAGERDTTSKRQLSRPLSAASSQCSERKDSFADSTRVILDAMDAFFFQTTNSALRSFVAAELGDTTLATLASLTSDLQLDCSYSDSVCDDDDEEEPALEGPLTSMTRLTGGLMSRSLLTPGQQVTLLSELGVNPCGPHPWPLYIASETLSLLTRVMWGGALSEGSTTTPGGGVNAEATVSLWRKLLISLKTAVTDGCRGNARAASDLNVAHCQLALALFHALDTSARRDVLHLLVRTIIDVGEMDPARLAVCSPLPVTRLLQIFDYMLRYYEAAPDYLLDHVKANLFGDFEGVTALEFGNLGMEYSMTAKDSLNSPRFYTLYACDENDSAVPLGTPPTDLSAEIYSVLLATSAKYSFLYRACYKLLICGSQLHKEVPFPSSHLDVCSVSFHVTLNWRLLDVMPPSFEFLKSLSEDHLPDHLCDRSPAYLLMALRAATRMDNQDYRDWVKDVFVKLGVGLVVATKTLTNLQDTFKQPNLQTILATAFINTQLAGLSKLFTTIVGDQSQRDSEHTDSTSSSPEEGASGGVLTEEKGVGRPTLVSADSLPGFFFHWSMDVVLCLMTGILESSIGNSQAEVGKEDNNASVSEKTMTHIGTLITSVGKLIRGLTTCLRSSFVSTQLTELMKTEGSGPAQCDVYALLLSAAPGITLVPKLPSLREHLPNTITVALQKWAALKDFPQVASFKAVPAEACMESVLLAHVAAFASHSKKHISTGAQTGGENAGGIGWKKGSEVSVIQTAAEVPPACVQQCHQSAVKLLINLNMCQVKSMIPDSFFRALFSVLMDGTCGAVTAEIHSALLYCFGVEELEKRSFEVMLSKWHQLILAGEEIASVMGANAASAIVCTYVEALEDSLESETVMAAVGRFYSKPGALIKVLLCTGFKGQGSVACIQRVLSLLARLLLLAEQFPTESVYTGMVAALSSDLAALEQAQLREWLQKIVMTPVECYKNASELEYTVSLLHSITASMATEESLVPERLPFAILEALLQVAAYVLISPSCNVQGFSELIAVMATLARAGSGRGHIVLFKSVAEWIGHCAIQLTASVEPSDGAKALASGREDGTDTSGSVDDGTTRAVTMVEAASHLLRYICDVLSALQVDPADGDSLGEGESDDDNSGSEDDDTTEEDSDEDVLDNQLCTFVSTKKEFKQQHWYHCYTCNMVDSMGVCTVCAKVCHKDHELAYAKHGSFFCDCGAKDDHSCVALNKRVTSSTRAPVEAGANSNSNSSGGKKPVLSIFSSAPSSSTGGAKKKGKTEPARVYVKQSHKVKALLAKQLRKLHEEFMDILKTSELVQNTLRLVHAQESEYTERYSRSLPQSAIKLARQALIDTSTLTKRCTIATGNELLVSIQGSQEGIFENIRFNYQGEQGQVIRQLITSHVLRRVTMATLYTSQPKHQLLIVAHEKGKVSVVHLSALLKNTDSPKKKVIVRDTGSSTSAVTAALGKDSLLAVKRLASIPISFPILTLSASPSAEHLLAVCGHKDCHVLSITPAGTLGTHVVLHPGLETGNFIIKAVWIPGNQTQVAVVTADFIKIYKLSKNSVDLEYIFLLPTGKVRDVTVVVRDAVQYVLVMSSAGYIYSQAMVQDSSAANGPFYITNIVELHQPELKDVNSQIGGGGCSIYFSHSLQLLFVSYSLGKSFCCSLLDDLSASHCVSMIKSVASGKSGVIVNWSEVDRHPGLILASLQVSHAPICLMVTPYKVTAQEVKVAPTKTKLKANSIQDMIGVRHMSATGGRWKTTCVGLCDDGSLKIYAANEASTGFWTRAELNPPSPFNKTKHREKKRSRKAERPLGVTFSVDFFENCPQTVNYSLGGNDLLQLYNKAQLVSRLSDNNHQHYVMSSKASGFVLEVTGSSPNEMICGLRFLVGSHQSDRAPRSIQIFGRTKTFEARSSRWIDFPFTTAESYLATKTFEVTFGPSRDSEAITMLDCLRVHSKTKEAFGWNAETEETLRAEQKPGHAAAAGSREAASSGGGGYGKGSAHDSLEMDGGASAYMEHALPEMTQPLDRMVGSSVEVISLAITLCPATLRLVPSLSMGLRSPCSPSNLRELALNLSTDLLSLMPPSNVESQNVRLLTALFEKTSLAYEHMDQTMLGWVMHTLYSSEDLDCRTFQLLLESTRAVTSRPDNLVKYTSLDADITITDLETEDSSDVTDKHTSEDSPIVSAQEESGPGGKLSFVRRLSDVFWSVYRERPVYPTLTPACLPTFSCLSATVVSLVEVIHTFTLKQPDTAETAAELYAELLLCKDLSVSFACKQALTKVLQPKPKKKASVDMSAVAQEPPTPKETPKGRTRTPGHSDSTPITSRAGGPQLRPLEAAGQPNLGGRGGAGSANGGHGLGGLRGRGLGHGLGLGRGRGVGLIPQPLPGSLEALLMPQIGAGNLDMEDIELALALSMQDQHNAEEHELGLHIGDMGEDMEVVDIDMEDDEDDEGELLEEGELMDGGGGEDQPSDDLPLGAGHDPDNNLMADFGLLEDEEEALEEEMMMMMDEEDSETASAPPSDDDAVAAGGADPPLSESSAAAPDQAPAGEEASSIATNDEDMTEDKTSEAITVASSISTTTVTAEDGAAAQGGDENREEALELSALRRQLISSFLKCMPRVLDCGGVQSIPYMQVLLTLSSSDNDGSDDADTDSLSDIIQSALSYVLKLHQQAESSVPSEKSPASEVHLVTLRLMSVFMSRNGRATESPTPANLLAASTLVEADLIRYCFTTLSGLLHYWKGLSSQAAADIPRESGEDGSPSRQPSDSSNTAPPIGEPQPGALLPHHDLSPFFLRQYVREHAQDVFAHFPHLLTEILLRLVYQTEKIRTSPIYTSNAASKNVNAAASESTSEGPAASATTADTAAGSGTAAAAASVVSSLRRLGGDSGGILPDSALRLDGEMGSGSESTSGPECWEQLLSEYMSLTSVSSVIRRQVRKLLLFICGTKESYRSVRDAYNVGGQIARIHRVCVESGMEETPSPYGHISIPYLTLSDLMDHLRLVQEVAQHRTPNWQKFCLSHSVVLPFLMKAAVALDEGLAPNFIDLLQRALSPLKSPSGSDKGSKSGGSSSTSAGKATPSSSTTKKKTKTKALDSVPENSTTESAHATLTRRFLSDLPPDLLADFIKAFLLASNIGSLRWQAHTLLLGMFTQATSEQQAGLLSAMWRHWPYLSTYGGKASQFVDLLGYMVLKTRVPAQVAEGYLNKIVKLLVQENKRLDNHPNINIYGALQSLVEFHGHYMESEPCLVCNNPEIQYANTKLNSIKVDSKFTTTTQIVKLTGSHKISKVHLRINEVKKSKMVKTINLYYSGRSVQAVVELRSGSSIWQKAKKVTLAQNQSEATVEFALPIVACNLKIEYAEFYDSPLASPETLQCPRCSTTVAANPGICGNCGENVFQCHKCRSINYDERDPFLCNSCGFCKYAKFDYSFTCKPCSAVDPIDSEEDRKKTIASINALLEKADNSYQQIQQVRPVVEQLLAQISDTSGGGGSGSAPSGTGSSVSVGLVNRAIQQLAVQYGDDCKKSFDELSKTIQKVLASRQELLTYDRKQREAAIATMTSTPATPGGMGSPRSVSSQMIAEKFAVAASQLQKQSPRPLQTTATNCYGCLSASVGHCITMLKALAINSHSKATLVNMGTISELVASNLTRGTPAVRQSVRQLLCSLTKGSEQATNMLNSLLLERVTAALTNKSSTYAALSGAIHPDLSLLEATLQLTDDYWEARLKVLISLYLRSLRSQRQVAIDAVTLPCLRIIESLVSSQPHSKEFKKKSALILTSIRTESRSLGVEANEWLGEEAGHGFNNWRKRQSRAVPRTSSRLKLKGSTVRDRYLEEKYGKRWISGWKEAASGGRVLQGGTALEQYGALNLAKTSWFSLAIFSPRFQFARVTAINMLQTIAAMPNRCQSVLDLMTALLVQVPSAGNNCSHFVELYRKLIEKDHWKYYLVIKRDVIMRLAELISQEVECIQGREETTLASDLSQGYGLRALVSLLGQFVSEPRLKQLYKNRLVGTVLKGYLSLKRLVIQRTKMVEEAQELLLGMLEQLTTGTEAETVEFMKVCVDTVKKYPLDDLLSPVFIFERLCSIIFPEEKDTEDFPLILEKDPQQEDYLQGRMQGNPYSSSAPGLGPNMMDLKNKICRDCELIALLEDDNGMELLVNNKIISLELPVKEVYKKIWQPDHDQEPMRVVYRMTGLLGDATEDMVKTLDSGQAAEIDEEHVYRLASVMAECGGLDVMLTRLMLITDMKRGHQLVTVLLKLFNYCLKVQVNRAALIRPQRSAISIMLGALNKALVTDQEMGTSVGRGQTITEQLLEIMEGILSEASSMPPHQYTEFSKLCGDKDQLIALLDRIQRGFVRAHPAVLRALSSLLPLLACGEEEKRSTLVTHFLPYLAFQSYDRLHSPDDDLHLDCFCLVVAAIAANENGDRLKEAVIASGAVGDAVAYVLASAPPVRTLLATDQDDWQEFVSKPCLPYVLRLLTGLCQSHARCQQLVGDQLVPILHKLEQISTDGQIGTFAENLIDVIGAEPSVKTKIEDIRTQTRQEKKRLAMAMRQKQLKLLHMTANPQGQVVMSEGAGAVGAADLAALKEETGPTCSICREGYKYMPSKVLAIYTFTKRCNRDDFENRSRKSAGFSTVSHFNLVHVECHATALRHARSREEWESAALHNSNTKCNGLLPLWGPGVSESTFATSLARHNNYLQDSTNMYDASYTMGIHDVKHLFLRFAHEKSFSEDSEGGGKHSNMHLMPYLVHLALYMMNAQRNGAKELQNWKTHMDMPPARWIENSYECDGPLYYLVMSFFVVGPEEFAAHRHRFLSRLLLLQHTRHVSPRGVTRLSDRKPQDYKVYRPALLMLALAQMAYKYMFKAVTPGKDEAWCDALASYLRYNDSALYEAAQKMANELEKELLPTVSLQELCDAAGFLDIAEEPDKFLSELLQSHCAGST